jgi:hypothetical protein
MSANSRPGFFSRNKTPSTDAPTSDFIDIARQELQPDIATAETRARAALYDLMLRIKHGSSNRRVRLRQAVLEIALEDGFDNVVNTGRDIVRVWRGCAEEIESALHHVRHLFPEEVLSQLAQGSLTSRSKLAREQLDRALTGATPNASHRKYELGRAMQLCIEHFGYDASYMAAHKQVAEFRDNSNDLEVSLAELLFGDVCTHGAASQPAFHRVA